MNSIPVPSKLKINAENAAYNWKCFKQSWQNYEIATGIISKTEKEKTATFLMIIGEEALHIYNTFELEAEVKVVDVIDKFEKYFNPKRNTTFERFKLMSRKQKINETTD